MTGAHAQSGPKTEPRIGRSLSLDDAALRLGVSRRTIYNRIRDGRLQTIRTPGGSQRVLIGSLQHTEAVAAWPPVAVASPARETSSI